MKKIVGLHEITDQFDTIILDIWGVIHNGKELYPYVNDCLDQLNKSGKQIILLSNAPRRAEKAVVVLEKYGVPKAKYKNILTSGETCHDVIADPNSEFYGQPYIYIGPERDVNLLSDLPNQLTNDYSQAKFVLDLGYFEDGTGQTELEHILDQARSHNLPMVCANPDLVVNRGTETLPCAGLIAAQYIERGGEVIMFGKPYSPVYERIIANFNLNPARTAACGDSLETDIVGANKHGFISILTQTGILADKFLTQENHTSWLSDEGSEVAARLACDIKHTAPDYILPQLVW